MSGGDVPTGPGEGEARTRPLLGAFVVIAVISLLAAPMVLPVEQSGVNEPGILVAITLVGLIAGYLVAKRPDHPISWLLSAAAFAGGVAGFAALALPPGLSSMTWWQAALAVVSGPAWYALLFIVLVMIPLLFPTGSPPSPRWRIVGWVPGVSLALIAVAWMVQERFCTDWDSEEVCTSSVANPIGITGVQNPEQSALGSALFVLLVSGALFALASLIVRYRRSGSAERHQIKWVAFSIGLFTTGTILIDFVWSDLLDNPELAGSWMIDQVLWLMIPASIAVAILRYRLYDIDVVISKTLVYGALALLISGLYVGIVVGLGSVLGLYVGPDQPDTILGIAALVVIPIVFQPARRWLERRANRIVYGRRETPYEVLSSFSQRVAEVDPGVLVQMARSLAEGTTAESVGIWSGAGAGERLIASWPDGTGAYPAGRVATKPIVHQGDVLGRVTLTLSPGQALLPMDQKLMSQVASGLGLALRNRLLTQDLQIRVEQLRQSRRRIVAVQDQTRRQLERNLHDGAQQRLVALKIKLGLATAMAEKEELDGLSAVLADLRDQSDRVIETVREFARGIYPPLLEAEGLGAALSANFRKAPVPVSLQSSGVGRYPRELEATVYFCLLYAVSGAVARGAGSVQVLVDESDGSLLFQVRDDGVAASAAEMVNLVDRVDAAGGRLKVDSRPGHGTLVDASLPVLEAAAI